MDADNERGAATWLDDVTGVWVAITDEGLLVAEARGAARLFAFGAVEAVALSRRAPAMLWNPASARRRPRWQPAPTGTVIPVFACVIGLRAGPTLTLTNITIDEHGHILDRSRAYRHFVERLHLALVIGSRTTSFLAGNEDETAPAWRIAAYLAAITAGLLLVPWAGFPAMIPFAGAVLLVAFAAAVLLPGRAARFRATRESYNPARLPENYLPATPEGSYRNPPGP